MTLGHPVEQDDRPAERDGIRWLVGRGALFVVGGAIRALAALALLPVVTRALDPAEFGIASVAIVVATIVAGASSAGLHSAAMREYFGVDGRPEPKPAVALSYAALISSTLLFVLLWVSSALWSEPITGLAPGLNLTIALAVAVTMTVVTLGQNLLRAADRPYAYLLIALVGTLGGQVLGIALAWNDGSATRYLLGVAAGWMIAAVASILTTPMKRPSLPDRALLRRGLAVGLPTVPHSLGVFAMVLADRVVIQRVEGLDAVGRYQVAYLIGSLGVVFVVQYAGAWGPLVFGATDRDRWQLLADSTSTTGRLVAWVCAGLVLGGPVVLPLAAPSDYDPSGLARTVVIIAPAALAYVEYQAGAWVLFQERRTTALAVLTPAAAVLNIVLNLILVPHLGLFGAGLATTVAYAAWAVAVRAAVASVHVPWAWRSFVWSAVAVTAVTIVALGLPSSSGWLLVRAGLSAVCAGGLVHQGWRHLRPGALA